MNKENEITGKGDKGNYLVSVVTPFHNTNLQYFAKCLSSLKEQSIGFHNIEWVIVLHNSEREYVEGVHSLVDGLDNVIVKELYNEFRTASTPRNEGLRHIHAEYVFFLDADDYLYPEALESLHGAMEENEGDIGCCREESIKGSEHLEHGVNFFYLLDQTKPLLVLHRDSPDFGKFIFPQNLTVHKMYRVRLLKEHDILFSDVVRIGEDITYNLNCLRYAKSVVVLPQLIGYGYFMNEGSLVQTMTLDGFETTLNDRYHWVSMAAKTGLDASKVGWIGLASAAKILSSPGIPEETARVWKERFAPYANVFPPMTPSSKYPYYSKEAAAGMMMLVKHFFSDGGEKNPGRNIDLLYYILNKNKDTDLGQSCHFDAIHTYDAYLSSMGIKDYSFYGPLVELTTRIGETNIFSSEPIIGYSLTSGTSSKAKRIPYTAAHLEQYTHALRGILKGEEVTFAMVESLPKTSEFADKTRLDSIIGAALGALSGEIEDCSFSRRFKAGTLTSPKELFFPCEVLDPRYPRLLFALLEKDLTQIVAPFSWGVLDLFQFLERNHASLCEDIENGTISEKATIPESIRESLMKKLIPSKERADELRGIFSQGFEGIAKRIWPKCRRIIAAGDGAFSLYTRKLRHYCGNIPFHNGFYASSEAVIGQCLGENSEEYALLSDNAFYEFRKPTEERPVLLEEVKEGEEHEVILTNLAGLYRYRMGDVIKVRRVENGTPIFSFQYRLDEDCVLGDVRIHENTFELAVREIEEACSSDIRDFCYMGSAKEGITLFLEPAFEGEGKLGEDLSLPARRLDDYLSSKLPEYANARKNGLIGEPKVRLLEPETHLLYRDKRMFLSQSAPDQIKPIRLLDDEDKKRFFLFLSRD